MAWHCPLSIVIGNPLSIIRNHFSIQILNFEFIVSKTPQRANQKPYRHGTDAPRHYPHTLITVTIKTGCIYNGKKRAGLLITVHTATSIATHFDFHHGEKWISQCALCV
jgi:hypothetical protein